MTSCIAINKIGGKDINLLNHASSSKSITLIQNRERMIKCQIAHQSHLLPSLQAKLQGWPRLKN